MIKRKSRLLGAAHMAEQITPIVDRREDASHVEPLAREAQLC
jgi:hypothetical protein